MNDVDRLKKLEDVLEASKEWIKLRDRISAMGVPPHPDYWDQSVYEVEHKLRRAVAALS